MAAHDLVVIGASAGGVAPLREIVAGLPSDFPASVMVVLHLSREQPSMLADLLDRGGPLAASFAEEGEPIEPGRIYVAPADKHLMVEDEQLSVVYGPTENRHRPSVDVLFRSAARWYGPRVVGVVLSGALDDGTAGLVAIKIRGGVTVVQDPVEAFMSDMPRNALRYLEIDHVLPAAEIAPLLIRLTRERARPGEPASDDMAKETEIVELDPKVLEDGDKPGRNSVFSCPDCNGVLWEIEEGNLLRFRCRVGHAYSPESMVAAHSDSLERALFTALRILEERMALRKRMLSQAKERRLAHLAEHFQTELQTLEKDTDALRAAIRRQGAAETTG